MEFQFIFGTVYTGFWDSVNTGFWDSVHRFLGQCTQVSPPGDISAVRSTYRDILQYQNNNIKCLMKNNKPSGV